MLARRDFLAGVGMLGGPAQLKERKTEAVIENGFAAAAGVSSSGWYAGILELDNGESKFCRGLADPGRWACEQSEGGFDAEFRNAARWRLEVAAAQRRLHFLSRKTAGGGRLLDSAERIAGPAVPRERTPEPVVVWASRTRGRWALKLHNGNRTRLILDQQAMLRRPTVALTGGRIIIACEVDGAPRQVQILDGNGNPRERFVGMRPRLAGGGSHLYLLLERPNGDSIATFLLELDERLRLVREVIVPARNDYTWKGDVLWEEASRTVHVAVESCEAFGVDEQFSRARDVYCWSLAPTDGVFRPSVEPNRVPVECRAAALEPRLFLLQGGVSAGFRQYRVQPQKGTFGWDVWLASWKSGRWDGLTRVTESYGCADTGFDIVEDGGRTIGVFPCRSHMPGGHITARYWTEVVVVDQAAERAAPQVASCAIRKGLTRICLEPEPLPDAPQGFKLIWADLHRHSAYSTCQAPTNGSPEEHLRFVRDVLGCQVLTLSEHGHHMTAAESVYVQDRVEEFAGETCVVLYSDEPNPEPGRHTIFYTADRPVFEQLRTVFLSHGRARADVYRHIKAALPEGSVLAVTHFHGKPLPGNLARASHDPALDVAMEAMQIRGNVMLELHRESSGLLFPNDCLNLGMKVGLVGGTDHTFAADARRNHYCLTGLWVREATALGVMEALRARRTTAMSNGKIALWASLNGHAAGSEVSVSGPVRVRVSLSCGRRIRRAGLLRDGMLLGWTAVESNLAALELVDPEPPAGEHWYVVTAEMDTAFPSPGIAHASPFFVTVQR